MEVDDSRGKSNPFLYNNSYATELCNTHLLYLKTFHFYN